MATRRRVIRKGRRRFGCVGPILFIVVLFGIFFAFRHMRRPSRPVQQPSLAPWAETEPGPPAKRAEPASEVATEETVEQDPTEETAEPALGEDLPAGAATSSEEPAENAPSQEGRDRAQAPQ